MNVYIFLYSYIIKYIHADSCKYLNKYMHIYIHVYIHVYMYTYICVWMYIN